VHVGNAYAALEILHDLPLVKELSREIGGRGMNKDSYKKVTVSFGVRLRNLLLMDVWI